MVDYFHFCLEVKNLIRGNESDFFFFCRIKGDLDIFYFIYFKKNTFNILTLMHVYPSIFSTNIEKKGMTVIATCDGYIVIIRCDG